MSANPDLPQIISLWNALENKYIQQTFETLPLVMPSIKVNKKIGLPMTDRPVMTRQNIGNLNIIVQMDERKDSEFQVIEDQIILNSDEINRETHVQVRVLSAHDMLFDFTSGSLRTQEEVLQLNKPPSLF